MVVQFVAFVGAYRNPGSLDPWGAALLASLLVTWVTFVPCFLFIFLGAPYVERLRNNHHLTAALTGVTAAVVGVIANLAAFFAVNTLFDSVDRAEVGPIPCRCPNRLVRPTRAAALAFHCCSGSGGACCTPASARCGRRSTSWCTEGRGVQSAQLAGISAWPSGTMKLLADRIDRCPTESPAVAEPIDNAPCELIRWSGSSPPLVDYTGDTLGSSVAGRADLTWCTRLCRVEGCRWLPSPRR
jgi:hypothetical protein